MTIPKVILHRRPDNRLWEFWSFDEHGEKYAEEPIIEQDSGAIDAEMQRVVTPLMEALAWALPYAKEHAEQGSQCCGAPQYGEAEGICARCHEHTGFDNPDLEDALVALKAASEATG